MTLAALIEKYDQMCRVRATDWLPIDKRDWHQLRDALQRYEEALQSIANNSCCSQCREAALVAERALNPKEAE